MQAELFLMQKEKYWRQPWNNDKAYTHTELLKPSGMSGDMVFRCFSCRPNDLSLISWHTWGKKKLDVWNACAMPSFLRGAGKQTQECWSEALGLASQEYAAQRQQGRRCLRIKVEGENQSLERYHLHVCTEACMYPPTYPPTHTAHTYTHKDN